MRTLTDEATEQTMDYLEKKRRLEAGLPLRRSDKQIPCVCPELRPDNCGICVRVVDCKGLPR